MEKSTVVEILRTFSKEELAQFGDFVSSPYFNKKSNVAKLFNLLKKCAPVFAPDKIKKEELWKKIYPGKKYNYGVMKNLIYDLDKLSKQFLSVGKFRTHEIQQNKFLAIAAREKQLPWFHKKILARNEQILSLIPKDEFYYEEKIASAREHLNMNINNAYIDNAKVIMRESDLKLFLIKYFISSISLLTEEQRTNIKHDVELTVYLLDYTEKNLGKFKDDPIVVVYYYLMKSSLELENDNIYRAARKTVNDNFSAMDYMTQRNCYAAFISVCNRKINLFPHKTEEQQKELLKIHIEMLQKNLLGPENTSQIHIEMFRNIIVMCHFGNEIKLLSGVIEKYSGLVIQTNHDALRKYALAFLSIMKKEYETCLNYCSRINFIELYQPAKGSFWFKNDIKQLELQSYYELEMFDKLLSALDSYRHFILNSALMNEIMKEKNLKFNKYLYKVARNKMNQKPLSNSLLVNIERDNVANKKWLVNKIKQLL